MGFSQPGYRDSIDQMEVGPVSPTMRRDPKFNIDEIRYSILGGLLGAGLLFSLGAVGVSELLSGKTRIDSLASLLSNLCAASVIIFGGGLGVLACLIGVYTLSQRRKWFGKAILGQAQIVDLRLVRTEDDGVVTDCQYELALKIDQSSSADSCDQVVRAIVSDRIYKRCANFDAIPVHYSSTDPLEFLILGE
jgi:hypothetical protein